MKNENVSKNEIKIIVEAILEREKDGQLCPQTIERLVKLAEEDDEK